MTGGREVLDQWAGSDNCSGNPNDELGPPSPDEGPGGSCGCMALAKSFTLLASFSSAVKPKWSQRKLPAPGLAH